MTPDQSLSVALLAIYATLAIPVLYIAFRHGFKGWAIIGWGFLFAFCTLKMVGSGMSLSSSSGSSASIISSVGLSPLLLACAGVLHEAYFYRNHNNKARGPDAGKWSSTAVLAYHTIVMAGVALVASGSSSLSSDVSPDNIEKDERLARIGIAILFIAWVLLVGASIVVAFGSRSVQVEHRGPHADGTRLLFAVLLAMPFLGIRVIASLAYFATFNADLNGATGTLGIRIGLYIVEELIVTLLFVGVGLWTRNIHRQSIEQ